MSRLITATRLACATMALLVSPLFAQTKSTVAPQGTIRIGVLTDMASLYSDDTGAGSVEAVRMAAEDFMKKHPQMKVEVIYADHQNKPDIARTKAREWFDNEHVTMITDLVCSSAALAVWNVAKQKNRIAISNGGGSSDLTNGECTPVTIQYTYDTYSLARGTAGALTKRGADSWFFITADYTFGHALEKDATDVVLALGGKVLGSVAAPLNTPDFTSYVLRAQNSGAKAICLANAGGDAINTIKTAREFGILNGGKQQIASFILPITHIHSLGLESSQGLMLVTGFYWDFNEETRAWSRRFFDRMKKMPTMFQAGDYSSTLHYLDAVVAAGTDEAGPVMEKMRATPVNDFFAHNGYIRADGRMVHDMYLAQVKAPKDSKYPWDYFKIIDVIPGEESVRPLAKSACPLIKH